MDNSTGNAAAAEVVELVQDLIRIDTTNFGDDSGPGESAAAEYVQAKLAEVGIPAEMLRRRPDVRREEFRAAEEPPGRLPPVLPPMMLPPKSRAELSQLAPPWSCASAPPGSTQPNIAAPRRRNHTAAINPLRSACAASPPSIAPDFPIPSDNQSLASFRRY